MPAPSPSSDRHNEKGLPLGLLRIAHSFLLLETSNTPDGAPSDANDGDQNTGDVRGCSHNGSGGGGGGGGNGGSSGAALERVWRRLTRQLERLEDATLATALVGLLGALTRGLKKEEAAAA